MILGNNDPIQGVIISDIRDSMRPWMASLNLVVLREDQSSQRSFGLRVRAIFEDLQRGLKRLRLILTSKQRSCLRVWVLSGANARKHDQRFVREDKSLLQWSFASLLCAGEKTVRRRVSLFCRQGKFTSHRVLFHLSTRGEFALVWLEKWPSFCPRNWPKEDGKFF